MRLLLGPNLCSIKPDRSDAGLRIEVVYALKERQKVIVLEVFPGTTAREAAVMSGLDEFFSTLAVDTVPLGVYGERVDDDYVVADGDRVELYRPLVLDPMEARRQRAARQ